MTREDKKLLLQDLVARLPYGVKVLASEDMALTLRQIDSNGFCEAWENEDIKCHSRWMLPYLRPLSSMTEEEKRHISKMTLLRTYDNGVVYDIPYDVYTPYYVMEDCLNYLRSIHIDYSGLIEKGLAIAVTKENNPYKD